MKNYGRRLIIISIILYALTFIALIVRGMFLFEEKTLLLSFKTSWIIDTALITFTSLCIPVQVTAIVITYGLGSRRDESEILSSNPFYSIIKPAMIFFIIITAGFTVLSEGFVPVAQVRQQDRIYKTQVGRSLIDESTHARSDGNYEEARDYVKEYLAFDPGNREQQERLDEIEEDIAKSRSGALETGSPEKREEGLRPAMSADEFIEAAWKSFETGDYFSAHYYATLAYMTDPNRSDANALAKQAWAMIDEITPTPEEAEMYRVHEQKKRGFNALLADHPLEAYYIFMQLKKESPIDPDVETYLNESREAVKTISFFSDEIDKTLAFPGTRHIIFINSRDEVTRQLVFIDKFIPIREGYYLFGLEVLSFTPGGAINYHLKAPYGKIVSGRIVTLCIDREDKNLFTEAVYLDGFRPEAERNIIPLNISPDLISTFSAQKNFLSRISLPYLWDLGKTYTAFGMRKEPVNVEIAARIMKPFTFLLFSFLALASSWAMRPKHGRPRFIAYPLLALVPVVTFYLLTLYYYLARLLNAFLMISLGFGVALAAIVLIQGIFLVIVFLFLAGQSTE